MQTSYSNNFAVYNSTGYFLKGDKSLDKYIDLAREIDAKRSAFYFKSGKEGIIFGCDLRVQREKGREERVVFIQVCDQIDSDIKQVLEFYGNAIKEVESLESKKYKVVGLWNEGDINSIKREDVPEKVLRYTAGKMISGERVSIRSSDINVAINLVADTISFLKSSLSSDFVFMVSQYPMECDLSISLNEPNPEFILSPVMEEKIKPSYYTYYSLFYDVYAEFGESGFEENGRKYASRESLAFDTRQKVLSDNKSVIIDSFSSSDSLSEMFKMFENDTGLLNLIVLELVQKKDSEKLLQILKNNDELTKKLMLGLIKQADTSEEIRIFIEKLYEDSKTGYKNIRIDLESLLYDNYPWSSENASFFKSVVRYLIIDAINEKNPALFRTLQKPVKNHDYFKEVAHKVIRPDMIDKQKCADFVRWVIDKEPENGTKILLKEMPSSLFTSFSFTHEELSKIDQLTGTSYALSSNKKSSSFQEPSSETHEGLKPLKGGGAKQKKGNSVPIGVLAGVLALAGLILIGVSYLPSGSPDSPDNQSPGADLSPEVLYPAANLSITPYSKVLGKDEDNNTVYAPAPFDIKLKDTSENAETIKWDLGDGNTSQEKILHYTYLTPGTYNLTLYAENQNGTSSTYMYIKVVNVTGATDSKNNTEIKESYDNNNTKDNISTVDKSVANKTASVNKTGVVEVSFKSNPTANSNKVTFEDTSEGNITITKRYWDFGDGDNKTKTANETSVTHYYSDEKNVYNVSLTVTNENGTNFTKYQSIHIG